MKIHFCDLCNESVPQSALDSGAARLIKGRLICATCDAVMTHAQEPGAAPAIGTSGNAAPAIVVTATPALPPVPVSALDAGASPAYAPASARPDPVQASTAWQTAPPTGQPMGAGAAVVVPVVHAPAATKSSYTGIAWVAGLAMAFTAISIFVTDDRLASLGRAQGELANQLARNDDALRSLSGELGKVHPALAGVEARLAERIDAQSQRISASGETLDGVREDAMRLTLRLEGLALELERLRAKVEQPGLGQQIEARFDELTARMARAEDERRVLTEKLAALPTAAAAGPAAAAATPEAPAEKAAPAEWTKYLPDLSSGEETLRWEAVTTLGATKDPAVVPHLAPMLADASPFVRMAAARVLGELGSRDAVPKLLVVLEDQDSAVRETAWIALRVITGKDFKFDPYANEAERAKRVRAWTDWWKKEGGGDVTKPPSGT